MKRFAAALAAVFLFVLLTGCGVPAAAPAEPGPTAEPTASPSPSPAPTADPVEPERLRAADEARALAEQYFFSEALDRLADPALESDTVRAAREEILARQAALVPYEGELRHIFFHSLIVYPELIFYDRLTPMGGYNAGFSEKAELERILPQLYERGYVLYDLGECFEMGPEGMERKDILLPEGKIPLILSVDDVAYAYGPGYASRLYVAEDGSLLYEVPNPSGGLDVMPDGDVMGVVDAFVAEHPDFAWHGHKGTIALTGFQGAFGYPDYEQPENQQAIRTVAEALKADGWTFASHSYTHNSGFYGFWGAGCLPEKIHYDINKWVDRVTPWIGSTNLFIAPFGYRAQGEALRHVLDAGFDIYCTVDDHVVNELYPDYALMSRIEIGGYSMTYFREILNEKFFDVDSVFDAAGRPPVIA